MHALMRKTDKYGGVLEVPAKTRHRALPVYHFNFVDRTLESDRLRQFRRQGIDGQAQSQRQVLGFRPNRVAIQ